MRAKAALSTLAIAGSIAHAQPADAIYANANVYTVDDARPRATAFAVRDGAIVAVGDESDLIAHKGPDTEWVNLDGATVVPGLIDAHAHLAGLGQFELGVIDLSYATSYQQVIDLVRARAADTPAGDWIIGQGWDHESWPEREMPEHGPLTEAVPDHPVWLKRVDGHASLANSKAMDLAGVSPETPEPVGGDMLRDADGSLTGVFVDNAERLVELAIPDSAYPDMAAKFLEGQRLCFEAGLTGMHDMGLPPGALDLLRELEHAGDLKLRVHAMVGARKAIEFMNDRQPYVGDRLQVRAVKLYMDGAMGSRGAWMLEPYADRPTDEDGEPWVGLNVTDPEFVETVANVCLQRGYQLCTHAIGDRANREVLDAYERAFKTRAATKSDHRFRVEHAQLLAPAEILRFAQLGVIPAMQARHATSDMRWVDERVGPERAKGAYAWQSLIEAGSIVANGSDFPVEPHQPLLGFYASVTRQNAAGEPAGGWMPEERLTREQALKSFTIWAAHAAFMEDRVGSITPGKRADFTVLDRDIMACPAAEILDAKILRTVVDGETVFRVE